MKILITGATGFIGSSLVEKLAALDNEIFCLVRKTSNIKKLNQLGVNIIVGDLTDINSLDIIPEKLDIVFHLAAYVDFSAISETAKNNMIKQNVEASENLFKIVAKTSGTLKKFIFFSSLAAMGFQRSVSVSNKTKPNPGTIYGESKYFAELKLETLSKKLNIPLLVIRPSLVYGTEDKSSDYLNSCRLIKKGFFPIFGSGKNIMSPVIYLDDLIEICIRFTANDVIGHFICTNDEKFTIAEFIQTNAEVLKVKRGSIKIPVILGMLLIVPVEILCKIFNIPAPLNRRRIKDLSLDRKLENIHADLKKAIDYIPKTNLQNGSKKVISWYRENNLI